MFDKQAQALAVLRAAELQTGVSHQGSPKAKPTAAQTPAWEPTDNTQLPLTPKLAPLFPQGGIALGTVITVIGSRWLQYQLLASSAQSGNWVALVGQADVGALALAQAGLPLARVAVVPNPEPEAATVCAALLDGVHLIIGNDVMLRDSEKRRLSARAREKGTVIVSEQPWPGAHYNFQVTKRNWSGANQGEDWLSGGTVTVERTGRGSAAKPECFQIELVPDLDQIGSAS